MFDSSSPTVTLAEIRQMTGGLSSAEVGLDDRARIDMLRALEELRCAAAGAQAAIAADFDASQRETQRAAGVRRDDLGRGVASQIGLARRTSPHRAQQLLGLAKVLRTELPCTRRALRAGKMTEKAAMSVAQETACLSLENRMAVDEQVAGDLDAVESMSERQIASAARAKGIALDSAAIAERRRRAEWDRHVSLRPMPDVMAELRAMLPVKDGVAVWAVLSREADRARSAGDPRSRQQIMADTLRDRVLHPGPGAAAEVPLMVNVIVPDSVLLGDDDGVGWVQDYGPVPGDLLRQWIAHNAEHDVDQWVRRLYAAPATGELVTMDSKARRFNGKLAEFLRLRDQTCRTKYCDSRIRHLDHARRKADGGLTSAVNGQGLCECCNQAKEAYGWSARPRPGPRSTIETVTPTGHRYTSSPPVWSIQERGLAYAIDSWTLTA